MSLIFYRKSVIDLSEWLHESYLNNNEFIHKLTIQNEQLLGKLQDTCFSSYVLDCQMVDCLEGSHDMVDHEKRGNLNVLNVFEDELEEIQTLDVVEEELELSLDEGYAIFKEENDSSTLEPIYDKGFTLLKELNDTTHMDPSHDQNSAPFDHSGELAHSPTSYNSMFCSSSLNEVWVKGFFLWCHMRSMKSYFYVL